MRTEEEIEAKIEKLKELHGRYTFTEQSEAQRALNHSINTLRWVIGNTYISAEHNPVHNNEKSRKKYLGNTAQYSKKHVADMLYSFTDDIGVDMSGNEDAIDEWLEENG